MPAGKREKYPALVGRPSLPRRQRENPYWSTTNAAYRSAGEPVKCVSAVNAIHDTFVIFVPNKNADRLGTLKESPLVASFFCLTTSIWQRRFQAQPRGITKTGGKLIGQLLQLFHAWPGHYFHPAAAD